VIDEVIEDGPAEMPVDEPLPRYRNAVPRALAEIDEAPAADRSLRSTQPL
jgi:hypothetical protein